jgi:hypothetical protein
VVRRLSILVIAILVGAAAPARAWCEATCIAPVDATSHCPSHEQPSNDAPALTAAINAECPAIETARPVAAKLTIGIQATPSPKHPARMASARVRALPIRHVRALPVFDADVPLRI